MSDRRRIDPVWLIRSAAVFGSGAAAIAAFVFFLRFGASAGIGVIDLFRALLMLVATFWLAWGASQALLGLVSGRVLTRKTSGPLQSRVVVLVPIYEEDPVATFSRIAAMDRSVMDATDGAGFDFAILSDTQDAVVAARERLWYLRLLRERAGQGRIFYRRRARNEGRKAGNIEDFIRGSGAAYDFAIILDADSIMEGETMVEMALRMQDEPSLGLLQTLPVVVHARSLFGRVMQFAAAFHSPVFARGLARLQGRTGPFWGHNAIIRVRAFAQSCGLPEIPGRAPFGGPILSHDYVEAALLARAGWTVRLDADLGGSFEEGPENLIDHAKRDRRWCQGNLQHARLLAVPGLPGWSRFVFVQGILSYVVALFWAGFLVASILSPTMTSETGYFPIADWPVPAFSTADATVAAGLLIGIFGLLILPKLLICMDAVLRRRVRGFGGGLRAVVSTVAELLVSSVLAPILMMFQLRAIAQVLSGRDGGWPVQNRDGARLGVRQAFAATYFVVATGLLGMVLTYVLSPGIVLWLLPVTAPMILSPFIVAWSSREARGWLFTTPQELEPAPVLRLRAATLDDWLQDARYDPVIGAASSAAGQSDARPVHV
ncbi:MAG: glucans biosynthesis glucosyltransferase MdoH [Loktanella sp.]|nr:glucans biosynthesis glucosyltransferase MdoH [Loktanella sp.]